MASYKYGGHDTHTVSANSTDLGVATVSVSGDEIEVAGVTAGTATITVTATDGSGAANATSEPATLAATVTGTSNRAPAVDPLGHVIVTQGAAVAVTVAFRDADGDAVTLTTVSEDPAVATVSATSTELALPASATSTDILLTGVSEGLAAVRVVASDGAATSTPVVFPVTVVAPPPAGPVGDLWVTPEVSGGDYVVGWSEPDDAPRRWGLREVYESPGGAGGPDGTPSGAGPRRSPSRGGRPARTRTPCGGAAADCPSASTPGGAA